MLLERLHSALSNALDLVGDVEDVEEMRELLQEVADVIEATPENKEEENLTLGCRDAALVIREDGKIELYFPNGADDGPVPDATLAIMTLAACIEDRDAFSEMVEAFVDEMNEEDEAECGDGTAQA